MKFVCFFLKLFVGGVLLAERLINKDVVNIQRKWHGFSARLLGLAFKVIRRFHAVECMKIRRHPRLTHFGHMPSSLFCLPAGRNGRIEADYVWRHAGLQHVARQHERVLPWQPFRVPKWMLRSLALHSPIAHGQIPRALAHT